MWNVIFLPTIDRLNPAEAMTGMRITRRQKLFGLSLLVAAPSRVWAQGQPPDAPASYNGEGILIAFPDYPVNTDTWYGNAQNVGHAGALMISPTGGTRYYEFGRYPPGNGTVRKVPIPDATIGANGKATPASLKAILRKLSDFSGKKGRIRAAYFVNMDFGAMATKASENPPRYDILNFNCGHFALGVMHSGNPKIDKPTIINVSPNNVVDEYIEEGNAEILYNYQTDALSIGDSDESDAKI